MKSRLGYLFGKTRDGYLCSKSRLPFSFEKPLWVLQN
jgi:hypothetical protein